MHDQLGEIMDHFEILNDDGTVRYIVEGDKTYEMVNGEKILVESDGKRVKDKDRRPSGEDA